MLAEETDGELVRVIAQKADRAGDAEAELCRRFGPRARLYGLRHLRDETRARDLAQTVLLAVLEAARQGRVQDPDRVERFVLGACRNVASRMREAAAREAHDDDALEVASHMPELEMIDTGSLVRCLSALEIRAQTVVRLSFHDEQSAEEIAAELGTTPGNVRVLRHRAVAQLRRCLDGHREVGA